VAPSEAGVFVDFASFGGASYRVRPKQTVGIFEPFELVMQPGHRRTGERIERFAALSAAKPLQTMRVAMPMVCCRPALRTRYVRGRRFFDQLYYLVILIHLLK
jgi:hypothetical protein